MTDARDLARRLVPELVRKGALAVAVTGSHARGNATDRSDLDLMVVGDGPDYLLEMREGVLVAQAWASEPEHRAQMSDPGRAGSAVPGWRRATVLHDPAGSAARLQQEALDWDWARIGGRCDEWVAEQVAGLAEEVAKLTSALQRELTLTAAVQRDLLALGLAPILAVHGRILYGSENLLWDQVGERMGAEWRAAQAAAFAIDCESLEQSCQAALRLYRIAAGAVSGLLDPRQAAVVGHAVGLTPS